MNKVWKLSLLVSVLILGYLIYKSSDVSSDANKKQLNILVKNGFQSETPNLTETYILASQEIKRLSSVQKQCRKSPPFKRASEFDQRLINALEQELKRGSTPKELLAYTSQYDTYYGSRYGDLLLEAQINIEKSKYNVASSIAELSGWNGLSIIDGLSSLVISTIVNTFSTIEDIPFSIPLKLDNSDIKPKIKALLSNGENFNTYLEHIFSITNSSVISPSILFIMVAENLTIDEFKSAASGHSFTVNDVAYAIKRQLPIGYLKALIENTQSIKDMPIFVAEGFYYNYNLADLAVREYNTEALKILESKGVRPINEEGIITGMDIAIVNLPKTPQDYKNLKQFSKKYLNMLVYLRENGYRAHGRVNNNSDLPVITFVAPYSTSFDSDKALEPDLHDFLNSIELIDANANIKQAEENDSPLSNVFKAIRVQGADLLVCKNIESEILAAQNFSTKSKAVKVVHELRASDNYIAPQLQAIDPVLVHLWYVMEDNKSSIASFSNQEGDFTAFLKNGFYQKALDYSASVPLTQQETDFLLSIISRKTNKTVRIWNARISPKQPTSLMVFKHLSMDKWRDLLDEKFDYSLKDVWGNDIFLPAIINSEEAVSFLLDKGFRPNIESLGLDVFDLALEDSYEHGRLNKNIYRVLSFVKKMEPNHYARIVRLKNFFPNEYEQLIKVSDTLIPPENMQMNEYKYDKSVYY